MAIVTFMLEQLSRAVIFFRPVAKAIPVVMLTSIFCSCQTVPREYPLKAFTTDGCTGGPEGTRSDPDAWLGACLEHDYRYWQVGTLKQRREADIVLREQIRDSGHPVVANLAFLSVRFGGSAVWPTPWRWGYGWEGYPRFPRPLTQAEKKKVTAEIRPHQL